MEEKIVGTGRKQRNEWTKTKWIKKWTKDKNKEGEDKDYERKMGRPKIVTSEKIQREFLFVG